MDWHFCGLSQDASSFILLFVIVVGFSSPAECNGRKRDVVKHEGRLVGQVNHIRYLPYEAVGSLANSAEIILDRAFCERISAVIADYCPAVRQVHGLFRGATCLDLDHLKAVRSL